MNEEQSASLDISVQSESLADRAEQAVVGYRAGDRTFLDKLVREATPLLWHTVRSQGVDREQAEDIVQNVWVALVRDIHAIRDPRATLQWLLVTARRAAWRAVQRARQELVRQVDDERAMDKLIESPEQAPGVELERNERDSVLWFQFQRLSDRCRRLLRMVSLVDRPDYAAVSHSLGMPIGSIGPTRGRCLAKLRLLLSADPRWSV